MERIQDQGCIPWILLEVPSHRASVPRMIAKNAVFGSAVVPYLSTPQDLVTRDLVMESIKQELTSAGANIIDVSKMLLSNDKKCYLAKKGNLIFYYDNNHLTREGALFVNSAFSVTFEN